MRLFLIIAYLYLFCFKSHDDYARKFADLVSYLYIIYCHTGSNIENKLYIGIDSSGSFMEIFTTQFFFCIICAAIKMSIDPSYPNWACLLQQFYLCMYTYVWHVCLNLVLVSAEA